MGSEVGIDERAALARRRSGLSHQCGRRGEGGGSVRIARVVGDCHRLMNDTSTPVGDGDIERVGSISLGGDLRIWMTYCQVSSPAPEPVVSAVTAAENMPWSALPPICLYETAWSSFRSVSDRRTLPDTCVCRKPYPG
jgi:hypothetical protein